MTSPQGLRREIAELEALLAGAPEDRESRWACYLLRHCLSRRRVRLDRLVRGGEVVNGAG